MTLTGCPQNPVLKFTPSKASHHFKQVAFEEVSQQHRGVQWQRSARWCVDGKFLTSSGGSWCSRWQYWYWWYYWWFRNSGRSSWGLVVYHVVEFHTSQLVVWDFWTISRTSCFGLFLPLVVLSFCCLLIKVSFFGSVHWLCVWKMDAIESWRYESSILVCEGTPPKFIDWNQKIPIEILLNIIHSPLYRGPFFKFNVVFCFFLGRKSSIMFEPMESYTGTVKKTKRVGAFCSQRISD